ncbi:MAG TPA: hypothetical protein VIZ62_06555 [Nitrososphaeraceae archaeon]
MHKYFFLFFLLFYIFQIGEFFNSGIVFGSFFTGYTTKLVEQTEVKNAMTNTSFNQEQSKLYLEKKIDNHNSGLDKPVVMVKINIFSCIIQNINSEKLCNILYDCNIELCKNIEARSNLMVYGKEPIYSIITSNTGITSNQIKLQPGEYEILLKNNDFRSSNYCNEILLDGLSFHEFTLGSKLPQDKASILCIHISDGCYGTIISGETKICQIHKVLLKNLF